MAATAWAIVLAAFLVSRAAGAQGPDSGAAPELRINSAARLIAGLAPAHAAHAELARKQTWKEHSSTMRAAWKRVNAGRVSAMTAWRDSVLPRTCPIGTTLLYPFSGPDFFNAYWLFPNCADFVLFGLEPVGEVPALESMNERQFARLLADVREAMANLFARNYFVTGKMAKELRTEQLRGVVPMFMISMALLGVEILRIAPLEPGPADGAAVARPPAAGDGAHRLHGVTVEFRRPGTTAVRRLHYFSLDASNAGVARYPEFLDYLRGLTPTTTLIKSASYLLHGGGFSRLREVLLDASAFLVQDDTGFPYSTLVKRGWELRLYGRYGVPIPPFEYAFQPDLALAYEVEQPRSLPFFFGYHRPRSEDRSHVIVGSRNVGTGAANPADQPGSVKR